MRRHLMLVASLPVLALAACSDGAPQTVQQGCGSRNGAAIAVQIGNVDLDTCDPDFSGRTVLVNLDGAPDTVDAPETLELSGSPEGYAWICHDVDKCERQQGATLHFDRFVEGEGATGTLTLVEEDGVERTIEIDALWCERAEGPPFCA